ncbi:MAG: hypothetical protein L6Q98_12100 [Anaerolineae bacterium]|nr:hypothetical protein [Anaerolineae bacterium]NUQ06320.1 PD40 domain-containing protein [Anaerolineae bacterium]
MGSVLRVLGGLVLLAALCAAGVQAQTPDPPLILWSRGDLYRAAGFDAPPERLTEDGTISGPALAPNGEWIAYKIASPVGLEALSRVQTEGFIAAFDLPADIVLYDAAGGGAISLTAQPAEAALFVEGQPDRAVLRSAPAWSPDSTQIAWVEVDYPDGTARLMLYEVAQAQSRLLAALPPQPNRLVPLNLVWGVGGIAVDLSPDAASDQFHVVYDPVSGQPTGAVGVAAVIGNSVRLTTWVVDSTGRALLGLLYESGGWTLVDPADNLPALYADLPALRTRAESSWLLRFGVDPSLGFYWEIGGSNAAAAGAPNGVALSPDGRRLAVVGQPADGVASIYDGTAMIALPGTGSGEDEIPVGAVLWGPMEWALGG